MFALAVVVTVPSAGSVVAGAQAAPAPPPSPPSPPSPPATPGTPDERGATPDDGAPPTQPAPADPGTVPPDAPEAAAETGEPDAPLLETNEFGPVILIEAIDITGNTATQSEIIRRALPIMPGDVLHASDRRLRDARFRVLALGFFRDVALAIH